MDLPHVEDDWIDNPLASTQRLQWRLLAAQSVLDAFSDGVSVTAWMGTFAPIRRALFHRAWTKAVPKSLRERVTFVQLGSAGRNEDLLGSDLDHALLAQDDATADAVLPYLYVFIRAMNDFLCPPCDGFVMSTNPRWSGSLVTWQQRLDQYFTYPAWDHARYLYMMTDSCPLDPSPEWDILLTQVFAGVRNSPFLHWEMAHLGIHQSVAIRRFGKLKTTRRGTVEELDIKDGLITPIVHAVRLLAIAEGSEQLRTKARSAYLNSTGVLTNRQHQNVMAALEFGWQLRLELQARRVLEGQPMRDTFDVTTLGRSRRDELRMHLETAKWLERFVHRRFPKPR